MLPTFPRKVDNFFCHQLLFSTTTNCAFADSVIPFFLQLSRGGPRLTGENNQAKFMFKWNDKKTPISPKMYQQAFLCNPFLFIESKLRSMGVQTTAVSFVGSQKLSERSRSQMFKIFRRVIFRSNGKIFWDSRKSFLPLWNMSCTLHILQLFEREKNFVSDTLGAKSCRRCCNSRTTCTRLAGLTPTSWVWSTRSEKTCSHHHQ